MKVYKPVAALVAAMLLISGCNAANDIPEHTSASTETIEALKDSAPEYITTTAYQLDEPIALDELEGSLLLEQTALSWAERKVGEWLAASDMDCDYKIISVDTDGSITAEIHKDSETHLLYFGTNDEEEIYLTVREEM